MEQVTRICKSDGSETTEPLQTRSGNGAQTDFAFYELTAVRQNRSE